MIIRKYRVELVKEESKRYEIENEQLTSPRKMAEVLIKTFNMDKLPQEKICLLAFDTKLKLIGAFDITTGTVNSTQIDMRSIFQRALLCNANSIAIAHNHPSGCSKPSSEDKLLTRRVLEAAQIMGIKFLDHIIIGDEKIYSFAEAHEI